MTGTAPGKIEILTTGVLQGKRRALAKALTLVESSRPADRGAAQQLLASLPAPKTRAWRVAITGTPGVGKSTFIEALGLLAIAANRRVAVLSVDPSSALSGGSILGDKTRMVRLATSDRAFIRPSPAGRTLGGVARRTRESIWLLEAAGYDFIVVETVGVGQSETTVADMTDCFILLLPPGGGDELQGIKRGIVELADVVLINKADGDLHDAAQRAQAEYQSALSLLRARHRGWSVPVGRCSATTGAGMDTVLSTLDSFFSLLDRSGDWSRVRREQMRSWLEHELNEQLRERIAAHSRTHELAQELSEQVAAGCLPPGVAAGRIIDSFLTARISESESA